MTPSIVSFFLAVRRSTTVVFPCTRSGAKRVPPGAGKSHATGPVGIDSEFPRVGSTSTTTSPPDTATNPTGGLSFLAHTAERPNARLKQNTQACRRIMIMDRFHLQGNQDIPTHAVQN